jgi:hypothetical protein
MKAKADSRIDAEIWGRVVRLGGHSVAAARALLALQFSDADRERMHELAAKARAGILSADEEAEATAYEQLGSLLGILHSQARLTLKHQRAAS